MDKQITEIAAAAATGVVSEWAGKAGGSAVGLLVTGLAAVGGYAMLPSAKGSMAPVYTGITSGAAAILGAKVIAPVLKTSGFPRRYRTGAVSAVAPVSVGHGINILDLI